MTGLPEASVGIDPSYSGYAVVVIDDDGHHEEHLLDLSPAKYGTGAARLFLVHACLSDLYASVRDRYDVHRICLEGYAPGSRFGREVLGELGGITRLALAQTWPPDLLTVVSPSAAKKFATGSGTAPKDTVLLQVYKKWGAEFASNDLADAYVLARVARGMTLGTSWKYEEQVVKALRSGKD
ncbi:hypothetical protein ACFVGM_08695 [Kitasatospora purpeofusca]|uniref:hypothetical protein n=1 Tax=Kitasatospora purpeofusca TaxID=67352 RepID=UPI0036BD853C